MEERRQTYKVLYLERDSGMRSAVKGALGSNFEIQFVSNLGQFDKKLQGADGFSYLVFGVDGDKEDLGDFSFSAKSKRQIAALPHIVLTNIDDDDSCQELFEQGYNVLPRPNSGGYTPIKFRMLDDLREFECRIDTLKNIVSRKRTKSPKLTNREIGVLAALRNRQLQNREGFVTRSKIEKEVWGKPKQLGDKNLDVAIGNLRSKLKKLKIEIAYSTGQKAYSVVLH